MRKILFGILLGFILLFGCVEETPGIQLPDVEAPEANETGDEEAEYYIVPRDESIPEDAVKLTPEMDKNPPVIYSDEFQEPVPLPYPINSAGGEDSSFIVSDGNTLYFFFTPDVGVPVEKQILDGATGIYVSHKVDGEWSKPERIMLQDPGKLSGDGCEFVQGNKMWFCTVREGYTGIHWFTADYVDGTWTNWQNADEELKTEEYETGELHISSDGTELYFHSYRDGGQGGLDIWMSEKVDGEWGEPVNLEAVNSERDEGWPALSPDGKELWISKDYGLWRSKKVDGKWTEPELIVSPLAGEATIDSSGNVYFTHHFYDNDVMLEADIYVIYRK